MSEIEETWYLDTSNVLFEHKLSSTERFLTGVCKLMSMCLILASRDFMPQGMVKIGLALHL